MKPVIRFLLIISLFSCLSANAQYDQTGIDSLLLRMEKPFDTDRELFYSYLSVANSYLSIDINKSLKYAEEGARIATRKNNSYWTAEFHLLSGIAHFLTSQLDSAQYYLDRSSELQKQSIEEGTEDKEENDYLYIRLYTYSAGIYGSRSDFPLALENYLKALDVAERINDAEEIIVLYGSLADIYFRMSNHQQAEIYFLKKKQLSEDTNDLFGVAEAHLGLVPVLNSREEYNKALEYGRNAYCFYSEQAQTPPDKLMDAAMRITEILIALSDYDNAMEYARAAVVHAQKAAIPTFLTSALYTLSTVYLKQGRYRECKDVAFQALTADSSNTYMNSILYGNIAQSYIWQKNPSRAVEYFRKTLDANRLFSNQNFQTSLSEMEVKHETEKKELLIGELKKEKRLISWLGLAGILTLLLALGFFFFLWRWSVQEKQLIATQAVLDGEIAERTRLARDLHDSLGSMLTGVKLNLESMKDDVSTEKMDVRFFDNAMGMLNESMLELRRVAHHLMPESLNRHGVKTALTDFCNSFLIIDFAYFGDEERFDSQMEVMIFRIIHELVNNALKYAEASQIQVQIMKESEYIALIVRDNGSGFDVSSETKGMGLQNIRDRVSSYNGRMEIDSKIGEGTEINIEFKIEKWRIKE